MVVVVTASVVVVVSSVVVVVASVLVVVSAAVVVVAWVVEVVAADSSSSPLLDRTMARIMARMTAPPIATHTQTLIPPDVPPSLVIENQPPSGFIIGIRDRNP
jgi:hypothetical protein